MSFLGELKRRKMIQVAAVYAVVAWLLVQIVATIEAPLNLPDWADTLVIVLLAVGFPMTLIISWGYNLTPAGLVREEGNPGTLQKPGSKIEYALIGLLVLAMLWVLYRVEFQRGPAVNQEAAPEVMASAAQQAEARSGILPNSIAVLPFTNLSPDPDNAFFAAGVHEEILNQLARIRNINVIARTSVMRYENNPPPVPQIAAELKVATVMEGSVRYAGDTVRVTAQLIDGASAAHLWTESYDGDLSDVFGFQTDIASNIAASLEAELAPETRARLEKPLTDSPAAYALYLQAKDHSNNGRFDEAMPLLDRAIGLDPEFAAAYAYRGYRSAWAIVNTLVAASADPVVLQALEEQALRDADRALALDENLGLAWLARAGLDRLSFRWKSASEEYARALALNPNDAGALIEYGHFKAETGDCAAGMSLARRSLKLNPNDLLPYLQFTLTAGICDEDEEVLQYLETGSELAPGNPIVMNALGYAHLALQNADLAASYFRTAEKMFTDDQAAERLFSDNLAIMLPGQIYAYGLLGLEDDAARVYRLFRPWADKLNVGAGEMMFTTLGIGDVDAALEWLERAVDRIENGERDAGYLPLALLKNNIHEDPILEQPRFGRLFDRIDKIARSR